jgi:hypothetical protein
MPSTQKTAMLLLNKWLGTDKPKREDFNADNDKLDAAFGDLNARVQSSEQRLGAFEGHVEDGSLHVTAEEKEQWGNGGSGGSAVEVGSYTGNGNGIRTIELGFKPRFGALFAVGKNMVDGDWNSGECAVYAGFFSTEGCSADIAITDTGFTVQHMVTLPINGAAVRFNQGGVVYGYVVGR